MQPTNSTSNFTPFKVYSDLLAQKGSIIKDNKSLSGVYRWINKINGKTYIGSSINLGRRFRDYFSKSFLENKNMVIHNALLKYGSENFTLEILEICDASEVVSREQYYFDLLKPDYNILPNAHSSLGYKHTPETLLKLKDRKLTPEHLDKLRAHLVVLNKSDEHKERARIRMINLNYLKGTSVEVFDMETKKTEIFNSIRKAAKAIGCVHRTITLADNTFRNKGINRPIKKRYLVKFIN